MKTITRIFTVFIFILSGLTASAKSVFASAYPGELKQNIQNRIVGSASTDPSSGDPAADLSITQSNTDTSIYVNEVFRTTLTVTNHGPDAAKNVKVYGTSSVSGTAVLSYTGWNCVTWEYHLYCILENLATDASASIDISYTAPSEPITVDGEVTVSSDATDENLTNNQMVTTLTILPLPSADLSTTQSSSAASVYTDDSFTLTLKVQNDGPDAAQPVTVTDQISGAQNVTFNSPAGWDCSKANETVTCTAASLDAGAAVDLEFTITAPGAPGTVASQANAASDTADPQPANNASTRSVEVARRPLADLSITQSGAAAVHPTDVFPLTLTVYNDGPDAAQNVLVTQTIQGAQQFDFSGNPTWDCTAAGNTLSCLLNQLAAGENASLQVTLTAPNAEGTLASQANVASDTADPQSANNTSSKTIAITHQPNADLAVSQATSVEEALVGSQFTTTLTVSNDGPDAAQDLVLTTAITGSEVFTVTPGDWECTDQNHQLVCKLAELPEGETADLILTITTPDTPVQINTQSTVTSATTDPEESNNQAAASVSVRALSAALSITQASSAPAVVAENPLTFTLSVANQGPDAAQNVLVTAALSDGVKFVSASGTGWDCSYAAGKVTCERASLAANIVSAITLNVVAPAAPGAITSLAKVQSDTPDPSAADNQATTQVLVGASPVDTGVKIYLPVILK